MEGGNHIATAQITKSENEILTGEIQYRKQEVGHILPQVSRLNDVQHKPVSS